MSKYKQFIAGLIIGALLFAIPALANNAKTIEAFYNNIKLKVYGQFVDTEGNEPFIVNGRTYVPARYVAEAMGGVVKWNETENTVEVTKPTPEPAAMPEPTKIASDGLIFEYRYDFLGYFSHIESINERHGSTHKTIGTKDSGFSVVITKGTKNCTVPISLANGVYVSIETYENLLLPFLSN